MHSGSPKEPRSAKNGPGLESDDWMDISVPISEGMVTWPGDPPVRILRLSDIDNGDDCTLSALSMSVHTATHMDAPSHFTNLRHGIDEMPLSAVVGNARVIEIDDPVSVKVDELRAHKIKKGERILLKTRNSRERWDHKPFDESYVFLSTEAALFLVEKGVLTIGVDYLSIGGYGGNMAEVHKIILSAKIWVIEGLDLSRPAPGLYEMVCLPIKIDNCDGAPARALLRPV
jgi:arylformamidase